MSGEETDLPAEVGQTPLAHRPWSSLYNEQTSTQVRTHQKREDVRYGKCVSGDSTEFLREDRQGCREDVVERDSQRPPASKSDIPQSQSVPKRSFKGGVRELRGAPEKSQLGKQPHALVKLQLRPPVRPRVLSESAVGAQEQRAVFVFVRRVASDAED